MAERVTMHGNGRAQRPQPLIGIIVKEDGQEIVHYFTDEAEARSFAATLGPRRSLAGAWSDMDADEVLSALDRIRHENPPTPPIELPDR